MPKATETNTPNLIAKPGKYLTFLLGTESYGLPVLKVREIIRVVEITPVPQMPRHIKGIINLRGKLVPVMDLRMRFDLPAADFNESTCIVVVQVKTASNVILHMGFVVDGVEEVVTFDEEDLEGTPDFGANQPTEYLLGMANVNAKVTALLDIDKVVDENAAATVKEAVGL